jgi:translation elongation factor EF-1alpha
MSEELAKDHLNVVFLGHTDAGKSSAIGHLLYKLGEVDKRVVDRWDRESRDNARPNMKFAWVSVFVVLYPSLWLRGCHLLHEDHLR